MSTEPDKSSLYNDLKQFFGKKAEEAEGGGTDEPDTGDGSDADAGQKQPPEGDEGGDEDGDAVEDLVRALAAELDEDPDDLMQAIGQAADDDEYEDEDDDEEEEEDGMKADEDDDTASVSIDFEQKMDEHDVATAGDLSDLRESIVDDIGEKLAESNQEAVEEIAQKMSEGSTPNPAGGSYQDSEDFEAHLSDIAEKDGW